MTTIGFVNPMAVGTRRRSDTHSLTGLGQSKSFNVFPRTGSRVATSTGTQVSRSRRRCQKPRPTLNNPAAAINNHAANM
jgi:hypothetical protein